jgi:hypothetical protein
MFQVFTYCPRLQKTRKKPNASVSPYHCTQRSATHIWVAQRSKQQISNFILLCTSNLSVYFVLSVESPIPHYQNLLHTITRRLNNIFNGVQTGYI